MDVLARMDGVFGVHSAPYVPWAETATVARLGSDARDYNIHVGRVAESQVPQSPALPLAEGFATHGEGSGRLRP
jgi:hypothetical protein